MRRTLKYPDALSASSFWMVNTGGFLLVGLLGLADYYSGSEVSFSLFYVLPISLVTWYGNKWLGMAGSVFAAGCRLAADLLSGHVYSSLYIAFWNDLVRLGFFFLITVLISRIKLILEREIHLADTDPLTGLANRRAFQEKAAHELERCRRYKNTFTIAYIDLDNFKAVNDTYGHPTGDQLLQVVTAELKLRTRKSDVCARLGGDEFAVLLSEVTYSEASSALKGLKEHLLAGMENHRWPVTFSIGAVTMVKPMGDIRDVIKLSDDLMYQVKKSGKNRIAHISWPLPSRASGSGAPDTETLEVTGGLPLPEALEGSGLRSILRKKPNSTNKS